MTNPPRVGERFLARLEDGRTWDGHCVEFAEQEECFGRVARKIVLALDPKLNPRLGKPNAGSYGQPSWHRMLVAEVDVGADYHAGWEWPGGMEPIGADLEAKA